MLSLFGVEFTLLGVICAGLLLIGIPIAALQNFFEGRESVGESIGGCLGGIGCLIVVILAMAFGVIWADNPFVRRAQESAPAAVTAPAAEESRVSRPDYLLSPPQNLELDYNSDDGSGRISWDASRWMPTKPSLSNKIEYEIIVKYPDNSMGPYITEEASYRFDYLNAESTGGVRISVKAVGIIRDGSNKYRYTGDVVETSWSPTND
ncbi:MAG: hypothetical protein OXG68_18965 [Chloroflexi bacterium]|nr:hypothetical protein [Chloroflexota bacterium]